MLLETLDVKVDDVLIYSQNIFDYEKNFKIIYKDEEYKYPHSITFKEVCRFIENKSPKNLIVYRLLTNIPNLDIELTKYGYLLDINGEVELIYLDPVFAVKELENYNKNFKLPDLRFKIQQVGLTSIPPKSSYPNFLEMYCFDLEAVEARIQNDKIFAEIIFAFDKKFSFEPQKIKKEVEVKSNAEKVNTDSALKRNIVEDKVYDHRQLVKIPNKVDKKVIVKKLFTHTSEKSKQEEATTKESVDTSEKLSDVEKKSNLSSFYELAKKEMKKSSAGTHKENKDVMNLFKSTSQIQEYIENRGHRPIVLRMDEE